jgi:hypothetical protein
MIDKGRTQFLTSEEVHDLLLHGRRYGLPLSTKAEARPPPGSMFLFDRARTPHFRTDGYDWARRETHAKRKVGDSFRLNCYYVGCPDDAVQRRCYWLLDDTASDLKSDLVLVHYLPPASAKPAWGAGGGGGGGGGEEDQEEVVLGEVWDGPGALGVGGEGDIQVQELPTRGDSAAATAAAVAAALATQHEALRHQAAQQVLPMLTVPSAALLDTAPTAGVGKEQLRATVAAADIADPDSMFSAMCGLHLVAGVSRAQCQRVCQLWMENALDDKQKKQLFMYIKANVDDDGAVADWVRGVIEKSGGGGA